MISTSSFMSTGPAVLPGPPSSPRTPVVLIGGTSLNPSPGSTFARRSSPHAREHPLVETRWVHRVESVHGNPSVPHPDDTKPRLIPFELLRERGSREPLHAASEDPRLLAPRPTNCCARASRRGVRG